MARAGFDSETRFPRHSPARGRKIRAGRGAHPRNSPALFSRDAPKGLSRGTFVLRVLVSGSVYACMELYALGFAFLGVAFVVRNCFIGRVVSLKAAGMDGIMFGR